AAFTHREVVSFLLDPTRCTADQPIHTARILEPSAGEGDFLLPIVSHLTSAFFRHGGKTSKADEQLREGLVVVEMRTDSHHVARLAVALGWCRLEPTSKSPGT